MGVSCATSDSVVGEADINEEDRRAGRVGEVLDDLEVASLHARAWSDPPLRAWSVFTLCPVVWKSGPISVSIQSCAFALEVCFARELETLFVWFDA